MRVLVTGADGFVGRHLCPYLETSGETVVQLTAADADITDAAAVHDAVEEARPEGVIHLAGFSSVSRSHREPARAFAVNALGAVNLLSALEQLAPRARVLLIGSAEMYGRVPQGQRASEDWPLRPVTVYASSKVAAEVAGFQVHRSSGLEVVSARSFNHLGRGQRTDFVVPALAEQIVAARRAAGPAVLRVGNLESVRDFLHVADVVAAYRLLLHQGVPGEVYNVCSGEGRSIRSLLDRMMELSGLALRVEVDAARVRAADVAWLVGDPSKLQRLGWSAVHQLDDALRDALAFAEEKA